MTDLGTLGNDTCSRALSINQDGQIVGVVSPCGGEFTHATLWENGGPMVDLDSLVLNLSGLTVREADFINDRGEIAGRAVLSNGDVHAVLLIPCDQDHPNVEGCDYDPEEAATAAPVRPALTIQVPGGATATAKLSHTEMMKRRNRGFRTFPPQ
jgi:probable HAF family extracellular repeat protein